MNERDIARAAGLDPGQQELLARLLAEEGLLDAGPDRIPARDPGDPLVLSHDQLRLWYLDQLAPGQPTYNIPAAVALPAAIDPAILERAVTELLRRHDVLRLRVPARLGAPAPELAPLAPFRLRCVDLPDLAPELRRARIDAVLADEVARPFDLAAGPLLRMALVRAPGGPDVLALTLHHLIADAWSIGLLVDELGALCRAFAAGEPSPLPAPRIQYPDYAAWQRRTRTADALADDLAWWAGQLADLTPLELPADLPPPARPTHRGGQRSAAIPPDITAALRALAVARGDTLFTLVHAALAALLARLTGRDDIAIGTVHAGRDHPDLQDLLGFLANTLVLRVRLDGDPPARAIVDRCRRVLHDAHARAHVPFDLVVQRLGVDRSAGDQPLFRVFFLLSRDRLGAQLERWPVHAGRARFDLMIHAVDRGDRLELLAEYSADRFEPASVDCLLAQLRTLLAGMVQDPATPLSRLRVSDLAEREFAHRHAITPPFDPADDLLPAFLAHVARRPDHPAALVLDSDPQRPGRPVAYRDLAAAAARIARALRRHGLGPGDPVAVLLPRDDTLLAAMLGVLALGATLVPLAGHLPDERRAWILRETGARALISHAPGPADLPHIDPRHPDARNHPPDDLLRPTVLPGQRAYVLTTSGSTGRPKGVVVQARALAELLATVARVIGLGPDDRVLAITSVIFDIAFVELLAPLIAGATVVLAPDDVRGDPRWLAPALAAADITVAQSTPSTWAALVAAGWRGSARLRMLAGGEVLSATLARALLARGSALWNGYGPTEATIYATFERVIDPDRGVTIGHPLPGRRALVLGPDLEPAPVGAPGELYLGGGLAEGYLGHPADTAARFVPDPARPGARLYATGDRARLRADGRIEFLGRGDGQVKVRGFRIELAEVEGALAALPAVRRAAVRVAGSAHDALLEAFLELAPGADLDPAALHHALAARLPDYMLPARYHAVAALPGTASGKLDRAALARLVVDAPAPALAPPQGPTERALAAIWTDLLALDAVDRHDNFYLRGGHSLLAVRLAVRIEEALGVRLPLRTIVAAPTLAGLAIEVDAARTGPGSGLPPIEPLGRDTAPLSPGQASIWRVCAALPTTPFFNLTSAFLVREDLPAWLLERALAALVQRHPTLRTGFEVAGDDVVQRVHPDNPVELHVVDLTAVPADDRPAHAQRELALARIRPLDLRARELLRALLVRLAPDCTIVNLTVHHIAADGWSVGVLAAELGALCEANAAGRPPELPAPRFTYADYAVWQQRRAVDLYPRLLDYWRRQLRDLRPFTLPPDHERPDRGPELCFDAGHLHHDFGPDLARALARRCTAAGTTPYVVLLAAFQLALGRRAGCGDVRVSTLVANRDRPGSEGVVGNFMNTLVLRTRLDLDAPLAPAIARVADTLADALAHQELPLDVLLGAVDLGLPRADLARIQVMSRPRPVAASGPVARQAELLGVAPPMVMTFDLFVTIDADGDDLALDIRYRDDRYEPATLAALVAELEALVVQS